MRARADEGEDECGLSPMGHSVTSASFCAYRRHACFAPWGSGREERPLRLHGKRRNRPEGQTGPACESEREKGNGGCANVRLHPHNTSVLSVFLRSAS
jgi:hypothetical protein